MIVLLSHALSFLIPHVHHGQFLFPSAEGYTESSVCTSSDIRMSRSHFGGMYHPTSLECTSNVCFPARKSCKPLGTFRDSRLSWKGTLCGSVCSDTPNYLLVFRSILTFIFLESVFYAATHVTQPPQDAMFEYLRGSQNDSLIFGHVASREETIDQYLGPASR